jgi:hypothetical protein
MTCINKSLTMILALLLVLPADLQAQQLPVFAQWARNMGASGLRRFYSTGADLGELVNRQVSYQVARRQELQIRTFAPGPPLPESAYATEMEGYVAQWDSLYRLKNTSSKPLYLRGLARTAKRLEWDKVHSRNDRYDLGVLYATSARSYLAAGLALEETRADLKNTVGSTRLSAAGLRLDGGWMISDTLSLGARIENLRFTGDNKVTVQAGPVLRTISRNIEYDRAYLQLEGILRLTSTQLDWLPAGWQFGGMVGLHWLKQDYENQLNSLGQVVNEPFGNSERLGVFRTGLFISGAMGADNSWSPYMEALVDRENTNLDSPFTSRNSSIFRTGLAKTLGTGKRVSLEWQHSNNTSSTRERDNLILLLVYDF